MGFEEWPDAGKVSSGVVGYLRDKLQARKFAEIKPDDFTGMEPELGLNEITEELARKGKLRQ